MDVIEGRAENQEIENSGVLKANVEAKGNKARTTISGESFEVLEWSAPYDATHIIGPGGVAGEDLMRYNLTYTNLDDDDIVDEGIGYESVSLGVAARDGEVKSCINANTFNDGIGKALNTNNSNRIVMYAPGTVVPRHGYKFTRSGNDFIYQNNGTGGPNYRATITVKNRINGALIITLEVHDDP